MTNPAVTRRHFIKSVITAGATLSFWPISYGIAETAGHRTAAAPAPSWVDKPMRWAQLTLVENDPGSFDLSLWLDYFRKVRADAVCLSGGGCVAYYPTQIPLHHHSRWLGERDVLGDLITGCRKLGMVVIVRTDPHATYDDVEA